MLLNQKSGRAADYRRSHTGSTQAEIVAGYARHGYRFVSGVRDHSLGIVSSQGATRYQERNHIVSRSHQIRLHDMVGQCRTFRAITRDRVIAGPVCAIRIHCADGDHVRVVTRRRDRSVSLVAQRIIATVVAGRHHHHDSRLPRRFHCLAKRIECITFEHWTTQ